MKQIIVSTVLVLLPLVLAAPTPHGFSPNLVACGSPFHCHPSSCDPPQDLPEPPVVAPPIIGCDPRICDPAPDFDIGLDINDINHKRSPAAEDGQHSGVGGGGVLDARAHISTTPPTRPVPEPDAVDRLKAREGSGIVVGNGLIQTSNNKINKRSRDHLPPPDPDCPNCLSKRSPRWTHGNSIRYSAVEESGTGVNNGKRDVDDAAINAPRFEVGNGIVGGRKAPRAGTVGGGNGVPPIPELTNDTGTEIGNEIGIGSRVKRGIIAVGGSTASAAHWRVGNGKEKRSRVSVSNRLE